MDGNLLGCIFVHSPSGTGVGETQGRTIVAGRCCCSVGNGGYPPSLGALSVRPPTPRHVKREEGQHGSDAAESSEPATLDRNPEQRYHQRGGSARPVRWRLVDVTQRIETGLSFDVVSFDLQAPQAPFSELHEAFELLIVTEGVFELHLEDQVRTLTAGEVALLAGWEWHGWRHPTRDPRSAVVVHFLPDLLGEFEFDNVPWQALFAAPIHIRPQAHSPHAKSHMLSIAQELALEHEQQRPGWHVGVRAALLRALLSLYREWRIPPRRERRPNRWPPI